MAANCASCKRTFISNEALQQHARDSPAHALPFECNICTRSFRSDDALQQHIRDAPAHAPPLTTFNSEEALQQHVRDSDVHGHDSPAQIKLAKCETCSRFFGSNKALQQHIRDSHAHVSLANCKTCNRTFSNDEALQQHVRDSPVHGRDSPAQMTLAKCEACHRTFGSDEALQQHIRDSHGQVPPTNCETCNRSFGSDEALQQHIRDSHGQVPPANCETCNRSFINNHALQQHLESSSAHLPQLNTPLDIFFLSFKTFDYNSALPPATSYARLAKHKGWRTNADNASAKKAWKEYRDALESELSLWYGSRDSLTAWHALCRAIGIDPPPQDCKQCEKAVRKTHVNIVDLIEWGRRRDVNEKPVRTFGKLSELRKYTNAQKKIFPNVFRGDKGNVVLKHLLRRIL